MLNYIENFFVHTGEAICGEQCCDYSPRMWWLARLMLRVFGPMNFDDNLAFEDTQTRVRFWLMQKFVRAAVWVSHKNPRKETTQCPCDECSDYSGE